MQENVVVAIVTAIITSGLAYLTSRNKDKTTLKQSIQESKVNLEKANTENAVLLYTQYQKTNEGLQSRIDTMQTKMDSMEKQWSEMKKQWEEKEEFYKITIEKLEDKNEILEIENKELIKENGILKGEKQ